MELANTLAKDKVDTTKKEINTLKQTLKQKSQEAKDSVKGFRDSETKAMKLYRDMETKYNALNAKRTTEIVAGKQAHELEMKKLELEQTYAKQNGARTALEMKNMNTLNRAAAGVEADKLKRENKNKEKEKINEGRDARVRQSQTLAYRGSGPQATATGLPLPEMILNLRQVQKRNRKDLGRTTKKWK